MSNTFDGVLREFPYIGVDRFNTSASVFLLTHCHADHLSGITNKSFTSIVYCSEETKLLLSLDSRLKGLLNLITGVPFNVKTRLETPHDTANAIYITLIEAYHCLGACMFLVEEVESSRNKQEDLENISFNCERVSRAVLCTGDIRAESWWRESARLSPALFPYTSGDKILNCIYFDSTFAYRGEPYIEIPTNFNGIHTAISMLREYPKNDPEIKFEFCDTTLGFEQAWAYVLSYFGGSLVVKASSLKQKLLLVAQYDRINGSILRRAMLPPTAFNTGPVFYGGSSPKGDFSIVRIKQCINFNIKDYTGICCPISIESIPSATDLNLLKVTKAGNKIYEFLGRHWVLPLKQNELLPLEIKLLFSRHSSYSEVREFLSMFKPQEVFPCVYSQEVWSSGFIMARIFGDICSRQEFNYDSMMATTYGLPSQEIRDRPVVTINRWNIEDCDREQMFIEELMRQRESQSETTSSSGLALLSLRKVARIPFFEADRTAEDVEFLQRRKKDFCLQKIVAGRRNTNFEKFIREQQMLYFRKHDLPQYKQDLHFPKYSRGLPSILAELSDDDSDSYESSFDLLEGARKNPPDSEGLSEKRIFKKTKHGLFWETHTLKSCHLSSNRYPSRISSLGSPPERQYSAKLKRKRQSLPHYRLKRNIETRAVAETQSSGCASGTWLENQLSYFE